MCRCSIACRLVAVCVLARQVKQLGNWPTGKEDTDIGCKRLLTGSSRRKTNVMSVVQHNGGTTASTMTVPVFRDVFTSCGMNTVCKEETGFCFVASSEQCIGSDSLVHVVCLLKDMYYGITSM